MKNKLLILALVWVVLAFAAYIYKFPPVNLTEDNKEEIAPDIVTNFKEPIATMDVSLIHNMVGHYKNNQLRLIQTEIKQDAQSVWFDLETLKTFVLQIEATAKKTDANTNITNLGLRFYYASYPENLNDFKYLKSTREDYKNMHTLVMIPTIKTKLGVVDFNPLDKETFTNKGLLNNSKRYGKDLAYNVQNAQGFKGLGNKTLMMALNISSLATQEYSTVAKNRGTLIPPPMDGHLAAFLIE